MVVEMFNLLLGWSTFVSQIDDFSAASAARDFSYRWRAPPSSIFFTLLYLYKGCAGPGCVHALLLVEIVIVLSPL